MTAKIKKMKHDEILKLDDRELTRIACSRVINHLNRAKTEMKVKSVVD